jgi:hypothetical protein
MYGCRKWQTYKLELKSRDHYVKYSTPSSVRRDGRSLCYLFDLRIDHTLAELYKASNTAHVSSLALGHSTDLPGALVDLVNSTVERKPRRPAFHHTTIALESTCEDGL